jgi:tRNA-dihydrouridine synthase
MLFKDKLVIRGLEISPPIALAPMVGLSHSALRSLVQDEGGVGLLFTEMLEAGRLPHDNERCSPLLIRSEGEHPLFYQMVTGSDQNTRPAVEKLHRLGAQGIDLNLGCPAPLQKRQGAGASLAENQERMCRVLRSLRKSTELPVSVKIRLGDSLDPRKSRMFCRLLEDEGVDLITIHARLNGEKFCRKPRWAVVGEIQDAVSVPIFINGGIFSVDDARKSLEQSGADGVMLGRGAVEKPWLCADIAREIYGVDKICRQKSVVEIYFRFITLLEERFAPERRLGRLKQFTSYFAAPFSFGHHLAASVQTSNTIDQAKLRAADFFARSA